MTQNQNYINNLLNTAIPSVYDTLFEYARSQNFWTISNETKLITQIFGLKSLMDKGLVNK
jgi:hypothetical protein